VTEKRKTQQYQWSIQKNVEVGLASISETPVPASVSISPAQLSLISISFDQPLHLGIEFDPQAISQPVHEVERAGDEDDVDHLLLAEPVLSQ
jgi:hypothetical protein